MRSARRPRTAATTTLRVLVAAVAAAVTAFAGAVPAQAAGPVEGDGYKIRLGGSYKCLNVRDESTADLAVVQMYECSLAWNNQWIFQREQTTLGTAYRIKARQAAGKCLDVRGASVDTGAQLQIYSCGPQWNQLFQLVGTGTGPVMLRALYTHEQTGRTPMCITSISETGGVKNLDLAQTIRCGRVPAWQEFYLERAV
jgi:hypothetical protein